MMTSLKELNDSPLAYQLPAHSQELEALMKRPCGLSITMVRKTKHIAFIGTSWKALDSVTDLCSHVFFRTEFFCDDFLRKQL